MPVRLIKKSMLLGLGVLTLTRDKIVQTVNSLVEEGDVTEEEAPNIIDKLVARGEEEREALRKMVRDEFEKRRAHAPIASHKDIEELSQKIDDLAASISELTDKKPAK